MLDYTSKYRDWSPNDRRKAARKLLDNNSEYLHVVIGHGDLENAYDDTNPVFLVFDNQDGEWVDLYQPNGYVDAEHTRAPIY